MSNIQSPHPTKTALRQAQGRGRPPEGKRSDLRPIPVDDPAPIGRDIHAPKLVRITGDHESGVVPVMVGVVDLRPTSAAIR
jgi:hypothetical protein